MYKTINGQLVISKKSTAEEINNILRKTGYKSVVFSDELVDDSIDSMTNTGILDIDIGDENILNGDLSSIKDEDSGPIIDLVDNIISKAISMNASDIHIEPSESYIRIRYRINGLLNEIDRISSPVIEFINARIKIISSLNLTERRKPQDGKSIYVLAGSRVDLRVSFIPGSYGERCVIRILDSHHISQGSTIAKSKSVMSIIEAANNKSGLIILCGPTGSGKTTTLYSVINAIKEQSRNILTIEDPIEYEIEGIGQTQVDQENGITFATGLRALLRQDPDVILIGEIRDEETAKIVLQSSLTGHLVITTLHANTSVGAIKRMVNLGVNEDTLLSSLKMVVSQRLVMILCDCKDRVDEELSIHGESLSSYSMPNGCNKCNHTGYSDRVSIYDVIRLTRTNKDTLRKKDFDNIEYEESLLSEAVKLVRDHLIEPDQLNNLVE